MNTPSSGHPPTPARAVAWAQGGSPRALAFLVNESAVYGVILVAGLLEIVAEDATAWDVLVKVTLTVVVFWAAHIFAGTVGHLSDDFGADAPPHRRLVGAAMYSVRHSWGMLVAALVPTIPLLIGYGGIVSDERAIWASMWTSVAVLGVLGFLKVAAWNSRLWLRLAGAVVTSSLGLLLVLLMAYVH